MNEWMNERTNERMNEWNETNWNAQGSEFEFDSRNSDFKKTLLYFTLLLFLQFITIIISMIVIICTN